MFDFLKQSCNKNTGVEIAKIEKNQKNFKIKKFAKNPNQSTLAKMEIFSTSHLIFSASVLNLAFLLYALTYAYAD